MQPFTQQIKVVYLVSNLNIGGVGRDVVEIARTLNHTHFAPQIYCISQGGALEKRAAEYGIPVSIYSLSKMSAKTFRFPTVQCIRKFGALYRYLRREKPDIVHGYMFTPPLYGGIAGRLSGVPTILANRVSLGVFKDRKPHHQLLENVVNWLLDAVLVNANAVKKDVLRREWISPEKIRVVYGGVDPERYAPETNERKRQKKRELGISEQALVIGMVANLFDYKGYQEFISAAHEVRQIYPESRFLCIGEDRGDQERLHMLVTRLGLEHQVIFTGPIYNMPDLFPALDIQVSASYREGFSNAILEGMACGKPIIATAVGGTPELVIHEETGLLIPQKDASALARAIVICLQNPTLMRAMGRNGRKRIEKHFSLQTIVTQLEAFYTELFHNKVKIS